MHVHALAWEQVVAVADQALYMAKRAGSGWVYVNATDAATPAVLGQRSLSQWIADGVVTVEMNCSSRYSARSASTGSTSVARTAGT